MFEGIAPALQGLTALRMPAATSADVQIWRIEDRDMCPDYNPGDLVEISFCQVDLDDLRASDTVVIKTPGGAQLLRYYTPIVDKHFEARAATPGFGELTTFKMDLQVVAVVTTHLRFCRTRGMND